MSNYQRLSDAKDGAQTEEKIQQNLKQIQKYQKWVEDNKKASLTKEDVHEKMSRTLQEYSKLLRSTQLMIFEFAKTPDNDGMKDKKINRYKGVLQDYSSKYSQFARGQVDMQKKLKARYSVNDPGQDSAPSSQREEQKLQATKEVRLQMDANFFEEMVNERDEETENLFKDVLEIEDLMKETSGVVRDQGEMIERIDDHIEDAKTKTKQGNVQLEKADGHLKKYNRRLCWLCMILIIVLVIVVCVVLSQLGYFKK